MNTKHRKRFKQHHELFIWIGESDQGDYDQYRGAVIIASSPEHAAVMFWKQRLAYARKNIHTLTKEEILDYLEDAFMYGCPIPKRWEPYIPEVKDTWGNDRAIWTFHAYGKPLPGVSAGVVMTDFHNG